MAFDGIITQAIAKELAEQITLGKIDKIYQPEADELVLHIHTRKGNRRLYITVDSSAACIRFIGENPVNPPQPLPFCMLLASTYRAAGSWLWSKRILNESWRFHSKL